MKTKVQKRLRRLRTQFNLTYDGLAAMLGTSRGTLYRWEAGIRKPNEKRMILALERLEQILQEGKND